MPILDNVAQLIGLTDWNWGTYCVWLLSSRVAEHGATGGKTPGELQVFVFLTYGIKRNVFFSCNALFLILITYIFYCWMEVEYTLIHEWTRRRWENQKMPQSNRKKLRIWWVQILVGSQTEHKHTHPLCLLLLAILRLMSTRFSSTPLWASLICREVHRVRYCPDVCSCIHLFWASH